MGDAKQSCVYCWYRKWWLLSFPLWTALSDVSFEAPSSPGCLAGSPETWLVLKMSGDSPAAPPWFSGPRGRPENVPLRKPLRYTAYIRSKSSRNNTYIKPIFFPFSLRVLYPRLGAGVQFAVSEQVCKENWVRCFKRTPSPFSFPILLPQALGPHTLGPECPLFPSQNLLSRRIWNSFTFKYKWRLQLRALPWAHGLCLQCCSNISSQLQRRARRHL